MTTVKIFILYQLEDEIKRTSVEESKYKEKPKSALIVPGESISKKEPSKISAKTKCAYTLFLVHVHYSIDKEITIHIFNRPLYQHCTIWVMNICQNISSSLSKNIFWKLII